jgi:hypothetical protein
MSQPKITYCLVDDTALTRNLDEIEAWVSKGLVVLVVPLYSERAYCNSEETSLTSVALSRLNVLKKDSSPIGTSARKAVKFLDRSTSSGSDLEHDPVILQGPDEQYAAWTEVEAHYENEAVKNAGMGDAVGGKVANAKEDKVTEPVQKTTVSTTTGTGNVLSQMLLEKLNFAKDPAATSPNSTPPLSPSSSGPQSSKTSPEVKSATMLKQDQAPVPPSLKPLLNPVVWYVHEKKSPAGEELIFLTNSADTMHLARDFGIPTKNIHQLRDALGQDENEVPRPVSSRDTSKRNSTAEPKTLFSYNDVESDEEEVVFKPRGSTNTRGMARGNPSGSLRSRGAPSQSPRTSFSTPQQTSQTQPKIPVNEIDPDSFDRGSFGRGSVPLVNTSNHVPSPYSNTRGPYRGSFVRAGGRGAGFNRGGFGPGIERGSTRGRGRLFVP